MTARRCVGSDGCSTTLLDDAPCSSWRGFLLCRSAAAARKCAFGRRVLGALAWRGRKGSSQAPHAWATRASGPVRPQPQQAARGAPLWDSPGRSWEATAVHGNPMPFPTFITRHEGTIFLPFLPRPLFSFPFFSHDTPLQRIKRSQIVQARA